MIQKLKFIVLSLSSLIIFSTPFAVAGVAAAAGNNSLDTAGHACTGTNGSLSNASSTDCSENLSTFDKYVKVALNILSVVVGIAAVFMIIFAGFRYVTSGGKEEGVKNAKNTILYAIVGLVVVALAQVIVHFVLTEASPSTVGS